MSESKFKTGDRVKVSSSEEAAAAHRMMPGYVPAPGTVGSVESTDSLGGWIRWTGEHGCVRDRTWIPFSYADPLTKEKIVIYREGRSVFARSLLNGKIAEATCSPEDEFDFRIGAQLAFNRLMGLEEKKPEGPKPELKKLLNMKVVCVELVTGIFGRAPSWWTLGKVYNVVDGIIRDDDGDARKPAHSLDELNKYIVGYAKFIELVE